jgi:rubrerythrin
MPSLPLDAPRPTAEWLAYFRGNVQSPTDMPWTERQEIPADVRRRILPSLKAFQKGEGSEGKHLMSAARVHAESSGDPDYAETTRLFIAEENKHSGFLALYLKAMGETVALSSFTDTVFRKLRAGMSLEVSIAVLLTAEILATVYYPAIKAAANEPLLSRICDRIVADENEHLVYQSERLARIRKGMGRGRTRLAMGLQRFLFAGTLVVVWFAYGSAFRAGGCPAAAFWRQSWAAFEGCARRMDPRAYAAWR